MQRRSRPITEFDEDLSTAVQASMYDETESDEEESEEAEEVVIPMFRKPVALSEQDTQVNEPVRQEQFSSLQEESPEVSAGPSDPVRELAHLRNQVLAN